jgi:hypothetical protein
MFLPLLRCDVALFAQQQAQVRLGDGNQAEEGPVFSDRLGASVTTITSRKRKRSPIVRSAL